MAAYQISVYQESMSNNGKMIKLEELDYKKLVTCIKNKYGKNPKRVFTESGVELSPDDMSPLEGESACVWTNGNTYEPTEKSITAARNVPVTIIADKAEVTFQAISQLKNAANRAEGCVLAFGMPDLHVGSPCPIGSVIISKDVIHPQFVGSDIGCGMSLYETSVRAGTIDFSKLKGKIDIDGPYFETNYDWEKIEGKLKEHGILTQDYNHLLGTVGGGNHFVEIQEIVSIPNPELLEKAGILEDRYHILVHSGSRGYGYDILKEYTGKVLSEKSEKTEYFRRHDEACRWAQLNRDLIAIRISDAVMPMTNIDRNISVFHNYVTTLLAGQATPLGLDGGDTYYVHRKGATPTINTNTDNLVLIPGSRGSYSYLVSPIQENAHKSGYSLSHGAGRRISRGKARAMKNDRKGKTKKRKEDLDHFVTNSMGGTIICGKPDLMYEEAPRAYKDIEAVISDLVTRELITIVAIFKPVLTYKCADKKQGN